MILRAENIAKNYNGRQVVKEISLEVKQGEIIGLLGPNGAGKTTSFYMIVGMIKPNGGNIYLNMKSRATNNSKDKRAKGSRRTSIDDSSLLSLGHGAAEDSDSVESATSA